MNLGCGPRRRHGAHWKTPTNETVPLSLIALSAEQSIIRCFFSAVRFLHLIVSSERNESQCITQRVVSTVLTFRTVVQWEDIVIVADANAQMRVLVAEDNAQGFVGTAGNYRRPNGSGSWRRARSMAFWTRRTSRRRTSTDSRILLRSTMKRFRHCGD